MRNPNLIKARKNGPPIVPSPLTFTSRLHSSSWCSENKHTSSQRGQENLALPFTVGGSRPNFLAIRAKLVALYRREFWVIEIERFVACRMLDRPLLELAPISAHPGLSNPGRRMLGKCLLVNSSRISWCIVSIAHNNPPEDVEAVGNMFTRQF